jgi:DNA-binding GntR family transcriptional regulator
MSTFVKPSPSEREPLNLRERAYDSFTRHLLSRELRAGQFISQRELVEITGLPLGAIREMIPRLEAEGLVRTVPQRGMQIAHVDLNLIRDAFQFRLFLEKGAVAVFTMEAPDGTLQRLRDQHEGIIAVCEKALSQGGITPDLVDKAQEIDWGFHRTIIDSLGNAIVTDAYRVNLLKVRLIRQEQTRLNNAVLIPTIREHLTVIDAIASRNPAKASEAMGLHIMSARDRAMGLR